MNGLSLFDSAICQYLAMTLSHVLWEGAVIVILTAAIAAVLRRNSSQIRYRVYLVAMLLMAACLPVTLAVLVATSSAVDQRVANINDSPVLRNDDGTNTPVAVGIIPAGPDLDANASTESPVAATVVEARHAILVRAGGVESTSATWHAVSPYVVAAYVLGLAIMLLRLGSSMYGGHRLRRDAIAVDEDDLLAAIRRVADRIGMRRVPLVAFCQRVTGPVVIGVLRPMVLLPVTLTTGLTPQQIEAVLTHEFAHLRRYDHVVLMLQRLIEAVLFFHPAVWYVSRCLSAERENCCDDAVIAAGAQRVAYAELLLRLAERQVSGQLIPTALAAAGERPSRLRRRVARLFGPPSEPMIRPGRSGTILMVCLVVAMIVVPSLTLVFADPAARGPADSARADEQERDLAAKDKDPERVRREELVNLRATVQKRLTRQRSIDEVERVAGRLTKRHADRAELGVIHAEVAAWFHKNADDTRAIAWAQTTRSFPLAVEDRLRMYEIWGDAARAKYEGQKSAEATMHHVAPNILGLFEVARHLTSIEDQGELARQRQRVLANRNALADNTALLAVNNLPVAKSVSRYLRLFPEMPFLRDAGREPLEPEPWVPPDYALYDSIRVDLEPLCESLLSPDGLLGVTELGQVVSDVVDSIRSDPKGPRIDIRSDLMRHLGHRLTVISDYASDGSAHRLLLGLELGNEEAFVTSLAKSMEFDPDVRELTCNRHRVWHILSDDRVVLAVSVANGYFLITHDTDLMDKVLSFRKEAQRDRAEGAAAATPAQREHAAAGDTQKDDKPNLAIPSDVLAAYLESPDENRERKARALGVVVNAQVVSLQFEHDTRTESPAEDTAFALSLKASSVLPYSQRDVGQQSPPNSRIRLVRTNSAIQAVFSKFFGAAEYMTPDQWLAQMKRPISAGYRLKSTTVIVTPSRDVMKASLAKSQSMARFVAGELAAIKKDFGQLDEFAASHVVPGKWDEGKWPRYSSVTYEHDVGTNSKNGFERLSDNWCSLSFGIGPIKGYPVQRPTPMRAYPNQGIQVGWTIESGSDALNKKFDEIVKASLQELDALEAELGDKEEATNPDD